MTGVPGPRLDRFARDGLTFDVRDSGPLGGPVAVCLHGFPQDGTAWGAVAPLLVDGGLRVLVPDQRGYSPGARPAGRSAYARRELVRDVLALLDAADVGAAHVVGHDWGAIVGWTLASRHPDRVLSLTALSTPHPAATARSLLHSSQALRLSYVAAFWVPRLPERVLLADDGARLRRWLLASGLPAERAEHYAARLREPGALTAALAWYRALPLGRGDRAGVVRVPATFVHGRDDPFVTPAAIRTTGRYVAGELRTTAVDGGHWVPERAPREVAAAVADGVRRAAGDVRT